MTLPPLSLLLTPQMLSTDLHGGLDNSSELSGVEAHRTGEALQSATCERASPMSGRAPLSRWACPVRRVLGHLYLVHKCVPGTYVVTKLGTSFYTHCVSGHAPFTEHAE
jgi:hypothetical protein